jgi:adenylyltransferase/sulfurtransferase
LRCLIPKVPPPFAMPTCQEAGVLGSFSQAIGYLQAHEALRIFRSGEASRLWKVNVQKEESRFIHVPRNPDCEVCGKVSTPSEMEVEACAKG